MQIPDQFVEAGQHLTKNQKKDYYCAVIEFLAFGIEPDVRGAAKAVIVAIRPQLETCRERRLNGSKGGAASPQANSEANAQAKPQANREANGQAKAEANAQANGQANHEAKAEANREANVEATQGEDVREGDAGTNEGAGKGTGTPYVEEKGEEEKGEKEKKEIKKKEEKETEKEKAKEKAVAEVVEHLNAVCGTSYKPNSQATVKFIGARLGEGYTVEDCKRVIDNQAACWLDNEQMRRYLRPSTLFRPSNFEGYLQSPTPTAGGGGEMPHEFSDYDW